MEAIPVTGADERFVRKLDMGELFLPVFWELVEDHCQHLVHRVVYTFHPPAAVWVVGAGDNFSNPERLINGVRKLGAEMEAGVRGNSARAPPEGNIPVDEKVSRTLSGGRCRCDGTNVGSAAETASEQ